jgi:hypothetical protein
MRRMTRLIPLALAAALLAAPATAQDAAEEPGLIEQGVEMMFRGLLEEASPAIGELAGIGQDLLPALELFGEEIGPAIAETLGQIDSIAYYELPVIEPDGDIVIRRRADAPAWVPPPPEVEATPAPEAAPDRAPDEGGSLFDFLGSPETEL